jgi:hypothetical protein
VEAIMELISKYKFKFKKIYWITRSSTLLERFTISSHQHLMQLFLKYDFVEIMFDSTVTKVEKEENDDLEFLNVHYTADDKEGVIKCNMVMNG